MLGQVGRVLLALLWRMDRRGVQQYNITTARARVAEVQTLLIDAKGREEGFLFQFDQLLQEIRNEVRVDKTELAATALPMNRLRLLHQKHT